MVILDVFDYNGKKAVYCKPDGELLKNISSKKAKINGRHYKILKADIMKSLSGNIAITLLLDTDEKISTKQNIYII